MDLTSNDVGWFLLSVVILEFIFMPAVSTNTTPLCEALYRNNHDVYKVNSIGKDEQEHGFAL
jgi:hypothetical protein